MRSTTTVCVAAAMTLIVAACSGGDDEANNDGGELVIVGDNGDDSGELVIAGTAGAAATDGGADGGDSDAESVDLTDEERALAFARCMRDEGVDWPDPTTNADGSVDFFGGLRTGVGAPDRSDEEVGAAFETCGPLVAGASFLPGGGNGFDAETQDRFLEFTQCLRDNGLDVDDPDFSNFGGNGGLPGGGGLLGGLDRSDPAVQDAVDVCRGLFAGGPLGRGTS